MKFHEISRAEISQADFTPAIVAKAPAAPAGAKKPARAAPEALRNYGKLKIPVFLMAGVNCNQFPPRMQAES